MRKFQDKTCSAYDTRELKREEAARIRQTTSRATTSREPVFQGAAGAARTAIPAHSSMIVGNVAPSNPNKAKGRQPKTLNLNTYKDHSLGDYVDTIRRNGTVDSYSTESVNGYSFSNCLCSGAYPHSTRWS